MKYVFTIFTLLLSSTFSYAFEDFPESAFGVRFGSFQEDTDTPLIIINPSHPIQGDDFRYNVGTTRVTKLVYSVHADTTYYMPFDVCEQKSKTYIDTFSKFWGEGRYKKLNYIGVEYLWSLNAGFIIVSCNEGVFHDTIGKFKLSIDFVDYEYREKYNREQFYLEHGYYPNDNDVKIDMFGF